MNYEIFRVIIAGTRTFTDYDLLIEKVTKLLINKIPFIKIISGCANGADKLGERYARECGFEVEQYPAKWDKYGKSAGYKRNEEMANNADALIVFWDGKSKGTGHMIDIADEKSLQVRIIKYE